MRRRIDMSEVESATKIRAKYLRALENEEWGLLPGPTYVKTFLRTYAEYLELDARALVDEYKRLYERPTGGELAPFGGLAGAAGGQRRPRRRRRRSLASFGPVATVAIGAVALLAIFYGLGVSGQDGDSDTPAGAPPPAVTPERAGTPAATARSRKRKRAPTRVRLRLVASGEVYVCLVDGRGRRLLDGRTLRAGDRTRRFVARVLRVNFGTSNVAMVVGRRRYRVARSARPVGYELRPGRAPRRLPDARRPSCA